MNVVMRRNAGFSLTEMLIVVSAIALVSSVGIMMYSGVLTDQNESVSVAMQQRLMNVAETYQSTHGNKLPNKMDSLLRDIVSRPYAGTFTTCGSVEVADDPKDALYVGYDTDPADNESDADAQSTGMNDAAYLGAFRSITVCKLSESDVDHLKELGITTVYDINPDRDLFHGGVSHVARELAEDDLVCMIDPRTCRNGISIYEGFGVDLSDTDTYTRATAGGGTDDYPIMKNDLDDAGRAAAIQKQRFLVFGIGPNCSLIGDRKGGLQEAPSCPIVNEGEYNRYFLVVKMPGGPNDMSAKVVGVLDSKGKAVAGARSWATRTE